MAGKKHSDDASERWRARKTELYVVDGCVGIYCPLCGAFVPLVDESGVDMCEHCPVEIAVRVSVRGLPIEE
jgi:hypothetical protein